MTSNINVNLNDPNIARWNPLVVAYATTATHGGLPRPVPVPLAMAWLGIESGGNPAAVGTSTATGPDGAPREIGLFQIYNPDDFKALGIDPLVLVAYCVRPAEGAKLHREADGGYADGTARNPQQLARPMTEGEQQAAIKIGVDFIGQKRDYAERYLAGNHITWAPTSPDFWATVKLVHALPSIVSTGLAQVTHALGRPPASWSEFRATYEKIVPAAAWSQSLHDAGAEQSVYYRALNNAEWTGSHVVPPAQPNV